MLLGRLRCLPRSILFSTNQLNCGVYRPALVIVFVDVCIPIDGHFYAAHFSVAIKGLSFGSFLSKEPATSMLILRRNASLVLLPELETTRMA